MALKIKKFTLEMRHSLFCEVRKMKMEKVVSLEIWNDKSFVLPVLSFLDSIASQFGADIVRYNRLRFAFCGILRSRVENCYPGGRGTLHVEIYRSQTSFEISIRDKGVPGWQDFSYDLEQVARDATALRNYILDQCVDGIGIEKLGKEGQRIYVRQSIKNPIEFKKPEPYQPMEVLDQNISIRPVETEQDAIEAIRCIYSEYGYSYAYENLYYVDSFLQAIRERQLISFLAVNDHGQTAGHFALSFSEIFKNMPEISSVVIRREFRGLKLFAKFVEHCIKIGKEQHFRALMGQPVAFHAKTQKVLMSHGFTATSLLMSYLASDTESEYNKGERLDLCAGVRILDPDAQSKVYPPKELIPFVQKIYDRLGWNYEICEEYCPAEHTQIKIEDAGTLKMTRILLNEAGEDLARLLKETVRDTIRKKNEMVELMIHLNNPSCACGYQAARDCKFAVSGVIPGGENGDYLMMQLLLGETFHYDRMELFGEFEELRDDIRKRSGL